MAAPKHKTKADREAYLAELSICYRKGWSNVRMSERFGIATRNIQRDCRILDQRFLDAQVSNVGRRRSMEVAKIDLAEADAWDAWDKSKEDAEVRTLRMRKAEAGAQGQPVDSTIRTEGQSGDPAYLRLVLECIRDRRKLQGTDRPERHDFRDFTDWTDEEIDQEIDRLERLERGEGAPAGTPGGEGAAPAGEGGGADTPPEAGPTAGEAAV